MPRYRLKLQFCNQDGQEGSVFHTKEFEADTPNDAIQNAEIVVDEPPDFTLSLATSESPSGTVKWKLDVPEPC